MRFAKDGESHGLLEKLNRIWIGSYVIRAFVPRFKRMALERKRREEREVFMGRVGEGVRVPLSGVGNSRGRDSYADIIMGGVGMGDGDSKVEERGKKGYLSREFQSSEEEGRWLQGALT